MEFNGPDTVVLIVERLEPAVCFYTGVLGLKVEQRSGPRARLSTGRTRIALCERQAMARSLGKAIGRPSPQAPAFSLGFQVPDVDLVYAQLCAAGAAPACRPTDREWGTRTAYVRDPDGYLIELVSPKVDRAESIRRFVDGALRGRGDLGKSTVTKSELESLEWWLGHPLPPSYRMLFGYKHFLGLQVDLRDPIRSDHHVTAAFFGHPREEWKDTLRELMVEAHEPEIARRLGVLPFAVYGDLGFACFHVGRRLDDGEYPIVLWDHDHPETVADLWRDFYALMAAAR